MAIPAVEGDLVMGTPPQSGCLPGSHQLISPTGNPIPNPPPGLPFVGKLNQRFVDSVTIGGKAAAVVGSKGDATVPHPGLHASDPAQANPKLQVGEITSGSLTVTFGGKAAASSDSMVKTCGGTAKLQCLTLNVTVG